MAFVSINSILYEIKNYYKFLLLISVGLVVFQISLNSQSEFFESNFVPHFLIVFMPLGVSAYSFIISKMYGGSRVFGRSYFALGVGYFANFLAELLYVYYFDFLGQEVPIIADYLLFSFYPLLLTHLVINIRYFAEKLDFLQKTMLVSIPIILIMFYSFFVFVNPVEDISDFYYSLIFVFLSSLQMSFVIVGFSLFRQTVLFSSWLLLLLGICVGTFGDLIYHYGSLFDGEWVDNVLALWTGSNLVMIYALYKHQKTL